MGARWGNGTRPVMFDSATVRSRITGRALGSIALDEETPRWGAWLEDGTDLGLFDSPEDAQQAVELAAPTRGGW